MKLNSKYYFQIIFYLFYSLNSYSADLTCNDLLKNDVNETDLQSSLQKTTIDQLNNKIKLTAKEKSDALNDFDFNNLSVLNKKLESDLKQYSIDHFRKWTQGVIENNKDNHLLIESLIKVRSEIYDAVILSNSDLFTVKTIKAAYDLSKFWTFLYTNNHSKFFDDSYKNYFFSFFNSNNYLLLLQYAGQKCDNLKTEAETKQIDNYFIELVNFVTKYNHISTLQSFEYYIFRKSPLFKFAENKEESDRKIYSIITDTDEYKSLEAKSEDFKSLTKKIKITDKKLIDNGEIFRDQEIRNFIAFNSIYYRQELILDFVERLTALSWFKRLDDDNKKSIFFILNYQLYHGTNAKSQHQKDLITKTINYILNNNLTLGIGYFPDEHDHPIMLNFNNLKIVPQHNSYRWSFRREPKIWFSGVKKSHYDFKDRKNHTILESSNQAQVGFLTAAIDLLVTKDVVLIEQNEQDFLKNYSQIQLISFIRYGKTFSKKEAATYIFNKLYYNKGSSINSEEKWVYLEKYFKELGVNKTLEEILEFGFQFETLPKLSDDELAPKWGSVNQIYDVNF